MTPTVSLITINYNSSRETLRLLDSIKSLYPSSGELAIEVLVVDNASELTDFLSLKEGLARHNDSRFQLIVSRTNLGFSGGNMLGAGFAKGRYFLFINNDCWLEQDLVGEFLKFMLAHETRERIAMLGALSLDETGKPSQSYGLLPTLSEKLFGRKFSQGLLALSGYLYRNLGEAKHVDLVSGSCMFVNAETFFRLGGLDTAYFLYSEEEDYGIRARKAGYRIYHLPWVRYFHIGGASTLEPTKGARDAGHGEVSSAHPNREGQTKTNPLPRPESHRDALKREFYISFFLYFRKHTDPIRVTLLRVFYYMRLRKKNPRIAQFILAGAPQAASLRWQQVRKEDR